MATLCTLPNELILETLHQVSPLDIESFCAISPRVYSLAKPMLAEHRRLKRKYSDFTEKVEVFDIERLVVFFENPRIARYVTNININNWLSSWSDAIYWLVDPSNDHVSYLLSTLEYAAQNASAIPKAERGDWVTAIREGNEGPLVALLLLHLPNLQSLTFRMYDYAPCPQLYSVLQSVGMSGCGSHLTHLNHVHLGVANIQFGTFDPGQIASLLLAFVRLPSLISLHVNNFPSTLDQSKFDEVVSTPSSTLTELRFIDSFVSETILSAIIQATCKLKSFVHSNHHHGIHLNKLFNCDVLSKVLSACASNTLENLTLRLYRITTSGIVCLDGYTVLRELHIDMDFSMSHSTTLETLNLQTNPSKIMAVVSLAGLTAVRKLGMSKNILLKYSEHELPISRLFPPSLEDFSIEFEGDGAVDSGDEECEDDNDHNGNHEDDDHDDTDSKEATDLEDNEGWEHHDDVETEPDLHEWDIRITLDKEAKKLIKRRFEKNSRHPDIAKVIESIKALLLVKEQYLRQWRELNLSGFGHCLPSVVFERTKYAASYVGIASSYNEFHNGGPVKCRHPAFSKCRCRRCEAGRSGVAAFFAPEPLPESPWSNVK